jgi:hypothetical protein
VFGEVPLLRVGVIIMALAMTEAAYLEARRRREL